MERIITNLFLLQEKALRLSSLPSVRARNLQRRLDPKVPITPLLLFFKPNLLSYIL